MIIIAKIKKINVILCNPKTKIMKSKIILTVSLMIGTMIMAAAVKVDICHNVDNNPHVINVAIPAAIAHFIQHPNDTLGQCGEGGGGDETPEK